MYLQNIILNGLRSDARSSNKICNTFSRVKVCRIKVYILLRVKITAFEIGLNILVRYN